MASPLRPPVIDRLNWARGAEAQEQIHRDTYVELYVYIYMCVCVRACWCKHPNIHILCIYIYVYTFNSISIHMQHLYTRHRKVKTVQVYLNSRNKPYLDV